MITPFVRRKEFASTRVRVPGGLIVSQGKAKGIPEWRRCTLNDHLRCRRKAVVSQPLKLAADRSRNVSE